MNITKLLIIFTALLLTVFFAARADSQTKKGEKMNVMKELKEGNARFVQEKMTHPNQGSARKTEVATAQHPKAIVLSCSDSRVPPEVVFDQGLGDLFVVRVAGNILNDVNIGSIEYAVEHLGVKDIVVLGHKRCGAVTAAVKGGDASGPVKSILDALAPSVDEARKGCEKCGLVEEASHVNVRNAVKKLRSIFKEANVVGAYYDLDSGKVEFFD